MKNSKPIDCEDCGSLLQPGCALIWHEGAPDDGGDVLGRRPAGWRGRHEDKAACEALRLEASRARSSRAREAGERAEAKAVSHARAVDGLRSEVLAHVGSLGLVEVPPLCTLPQIEDPRRLVPTREVTPEGLGFSHASSGWVTQGSNGAVAYFGPASGGGTTWASPELVRAGLSYYRAHQWWVRGTYAIDSYPGPAVPESDLTPEERAVVAALRAEKAEDRAVRERRSVDIALQGCAPLRALLELPGARFSLDLGEGFPEFCRRMSLSPYARERDEARLEVVVRVGLPPQHWTGGRLRAAAQKLVPECAVPGNRFIRFRVVVEPLT